MTLESTVAVPEPELALNVAVSEEPGTDAPAVPPEVADQFWVSIQFPVPPVVPVVTQNLLAMLTPQQAYQQARQQARQLRVVDCQ